MFNPPRKLREDIAPTEKDATFRKRLIWGEVHDENAWAMGGVAGPRGPVFHGRRYRRVRADDAQWRHLRPRAPARRSTIQQFTAHQTIGGSARALGWDVPEEPSSSGHYFSASSFGHSGFTGTSLWIDPERKLFVILLTNRVNPTRANEKIRQVRPALHDAIVARPRACYGAARCRPITPSAQSAHRNPASDPPLRLALPL